MENQPVKRGPGRPEGSLAKISREAREKAAAAGDLPHEFLLRIVRGEVIMRKEVDEAGKVSEVREVYDFEARKDAAKAAAPYYAPKISTVEVISGVSDADLDAIIASAAAQAGVGVSFGGEGEESGEGESEPATTGRRRVSF